MFIKSYKRTLCKKKTSHAANSKLFVNILRVAKYLKDDKHNSFYFARIHAHVFVLGQIPVHIFAPNGGNCLCNLHNVFNQILDSLSSESVAFTEKKDKLLLKFLILDCCICDAT